MKPKAEAQMLSVREALLGGYAELAAIQRELDEWLGRMGPRWRRDTTDRRYFTQAICRDLEKIEPPDLSVIPDDALTKEICANLIVERTARETRKQNAIAKLRPAMAALRKAGHEAIAEKVGKDIQQVDATYRIRGAYE